MYGPGVPYNPSPREMNFFPIGIQPNFNNSPFFSTQSPFFNTPSSSHDSAWISSATSRCSRVKRWTLSLRRHDSFQRY